MIFRIFCLSLAVATVCPAEIASSLDKILAVGREGEGNEAASEAWKELVKQGPEALLPVLAAAGKGNVIADNWLRLAANVIGDQAVASGARLPVEKLETFLRDRAHPSSARLMAFDLIQHADPAQADRIEPSLLNDPSQELRRGAVQRLIDSARKLAEAKQAEPAKKTYQEALDASRDEDQVKVIDEALSQLGVEVNLPRHFGFLTKWHVIGPFDNSKRAGFDAVYAPEKEVKLDASHPGKSGNVSWQAYETGHDYGMVDFNKPLSMLKDATAYATTTFNAPEEQDAEIRLGCKNGWKVWLNGELLFGRDEYHRGMQMDQYKLKCRLKKGPNIILVKCCQNEQTESWTVEWQFQLRVCDPAGTALADAGSLLPK